MKRICVLIGTLAVSTLNACGGAEPSGNMAVATAAGASALSSDCTGLVPATIPAGLSTTVELGECTPVGATSDGVGNHAVGTACFGAGFENWSLTDRNFAFRANVGFLAALDPKN